jgi:two-component system response regulator MprA
MNVIVVDDEYPLRAALRRALALEGYGVVTEAASGEEAIELLRDHTWDAMILDVLMPGLSGLEVCERLRADTDPDADRTRDGGRPGAGA